MCRQTFKTILSEGGGEAKHFWDAGCLSISGNGENARVFGLSQLVLPGVIACTEVEHRNRSKRVNNF